MNKIVLSQALKFKNNLPSNNQIKILIEEIKKYQKDNELYFFNTKHRQKPEILNEKDFFKFLSDINELKINNFEDIEFLLEESISRKESIEKTGDSKEYFAKVFDKVILFQIKDEKPILYKNLSKSSVLPAIYIFSPNIQHFMTVATSPGSKILSQIKLHSLCQYALNSSIYSSSFSFKIPFFITFKACSIDSTIIFTGSFQFGKALLTSKVQILLSSFICGKDFIFSP